MKAAALTVLKYAVALGLLVLVVRQVGFHRILASLAGVSALYWVLALIFASAAQLLAAMRMRYFFTASGLSMRPQFAVVLYYVGAFYNFLLPGGVGGDAYKVLLARTHMQVPAMQGIRIMLADRASGLCVLILWLLGAMYAIDFSRTIPMATLLLVLAGAVMLVAYAVLCERLLKQPARVMLLSLGYSFVSQAMWIATLATVWVSLSGTHLVEYIALYCAASITGMFPISVGGLGIKEMTYYYGAGVIEKFAGVSVNAELGVTLSLCLFAMMFLTALPGLFLMEKVKKTAH